MSPNRRILLNIVATYGRSLFGLACGLFSARWVLEALGKEDFGLYGVVGALTIFIAFLNMMLSGALGRYYAFSIGEAKKAADNGRAADGLENCRRWFNTALSIHTVVPVVLMLIGYPIGEWAVRNFLTIPTDRLETCVWVFRLACISSFVGMINVPFTAMYTAKQYIAELTIYSFAQTAANTAFFYFMATHPGAWLMKYAIWMCVVTALPQVIITARAFSVFPECKINIRYWGDVERIKSLGSYAGWQIFGGLGAMLRLQGIAIVVNKYFGPAMNASMNIANQVNSQTGTLSSAMLGAFTPAITTAYGSGDLETARQMSYRACKFGLVLILIFMIPLAIEIDEVMVLWLKNPPDCVGGLCLCMMAMLLVDKSTIGHMVAVQATGKIAAYQAVLGGSLIVSFPLAWFFVAMGWGIYSMCWAMLAMTMVMAWGRLFFARRLVALSIRHWIFRIALPVAVVVVPSALAAWSIRYLMPVSSLSRVAATTVVSEFVLLPLSWFLVLSAQEREFVLRRIRK